MKRVWLVGHGGKKSPDSVLALQQLLMRQRGISPEASEDFFNPRYEHSIHDPFLLPDMKQAVDRIYDAVKNHERIIVHGDYDADGISSTAILVTVLQDLGANVAPHLPHRTQDGYGLNQELLAELAAEMDLLITVDCGITSFAEISYLKKKKIDSIIIDHHSLPEQLPPAVAIIHPRHPETAYPSPWLCGAGVSWKVAQALVRDQRSIFKDDPDHEKWLLDLATVGTIADVVPLLQENRAIVRFGLEVLKRSRRPGLRALLRSARLDMAHLSVEDVAFRLVPRLNAAGRMDHAQPALELLLAQDENRVEMLLQELNSHNQQRQTLTKRVLREAELQVSEANSPFIFAHSLEWPAGVVGLAAGRLADKFGRPAIVIGRSGSKLVGSARSPKHTNILKLLQTGMKHLVKLGGHPQAAGFTVADGSITAFHEALQAKSVAATGAITREEFADTVITPNLINRDTLEAVRKFAPFGEGNKQPTFIVQRLPLVEMRPVGSEQKHVKVVLQHNDELLEGIGFGLHEHVKASVKKGEMVDVLCTIDENEFRGRRSLQLKLIDVASTGQTALKEQESNT